MNEIPEAIEIPDLEIGRYALRSFKWSVEQVKPVLGKFLDGLPPPPSMTNLISPWSPPPRESPYPPPGPAPLPMGLDARKYSVEFVPPSAAKKIGWWDDGAVRVWRSPSYNRGEDWEDGTCRAVCHKGSRAGWRGGRLVTLTNEVHDAPHEGCDCGIYGSLSYADLLYQFRSNASIMVAVIAAEGTTIIGDRGLRTQFARVVAYWTDDDPFHRIVSAAQFKDAKVFETPLDMVEAYGLRLLPPPEKDDYGGPNWWTAKC